MTGCRVSVVIPVYNAGQYLGECLDSVLGQTMKEIEVLCVDDGSTDDSAKILADYAARDARVKVLSQANAGPGAARNRALDAATGENVVFIDPDDFYPSCHVLEKLHDALSESGCPMSAGKIRRVPEGDPRAVKYNSSYDRLRSYPHCGLLTLDEFQTPFRYSCYMFRRSLLDNAGIRFPLWRRFQDPLFLAKALVAGGRLFAIDEFVYCYRLPKTPTRVDWDANGCARLREFVKAYDELLSFAVEHGCRKMFVETAVVLGHELRFHGISAAHPMWAEFRRIIGDIHRPGFMRPRDWMSLFGRVWSDGVLRRHGLDIARMTSWWTALKLYLWRMANWGR